MKSPSGWGVTPTGRKKQYPNERRMRMALKILAAIGGVMMVVLYCEGRDVALSGFRERPWIFQIAFPAYAVAWFLLTR